MTVINPDFRNLQNDLKKRNVSTKYGAVSSTNVKWEYNFDPLKKIAIIVFSALLIAGLTHHFVQKSNQKKQVSYLKTEAEKERREFLERKLEILKQKTIAAEMQKLEK